MKNLIALFFLCLSNVIYAEGSKDLYPNNIAKGTRAYLASGQKTVEANVFLEGVHFAWVKKGERLYVGSSAQNLKSGRIRVTSPSGKVYSTIANDIGKIFNRQAELAGPRIGTNGGYDAFEVDADEEGIWEVRFLAPEYNPTGQSPAIPANGNWIQEVSAFIAAWDVSVRDVSKSVWVNGRVFTHSLLMYLHNSTLNTPNGLGGYFGINYVLTNDGALYKVDANGCHGLGFAFFANNAGYLDDKGNPSYKSAGHFADKMHFPYLPDTEKYVTHKMFYNFPDLNLPKRARGEKYPGKETWLLTEEPKVVQVTDINLVGFEGTNGALNQKGAWISFGTSRAGKYKIEIGSKSLAHSFESRILLVEGKIGSNQVYWDGLDGNKKFIPFGLDYPVEIKISLIRGEVHFPYLDMEINPLGLKIQRFTISGQDLGDVKVYWDDEEISKNSTAPDRSNPIVNLTGILSNVNGHKWGSNYLQPQFADNKGMDTWTYSTDFSTSKLMNINVRKYDLKIETIQENKKEVLLNELFEYEVVITNQGPDEALGAGFVFEVPDGVEIVSVGTESSCGVVLTGINNKSKFKSSINLPSGCSLTYVFEARVSRYEEAFFNGIPVFAGVVRGSDATDPDATALSNKASVGSSIEECLSGCNNNKTNKKILLIDPAESDAKIGLLKEVTFRDKNKNGKIDEGDVLVYDFRVRNTGNAILQDIQLTDQKISTGSLLNRDNLPPGEEAHFQFEYFLKKEEIGKTISNTAEVLSYTSRRRKISDKSGTDFNNDNPTLFNTNLPSKIFLTKTVVNFGSGENRQFTRGDVIKYRFDIKHEGEELTNILLVDRLLEEYAIPIPVLEWNSVTTLYREYSITEDDVATGLVKNVASISGIEGQYSINIMDVSGHTFDDDEETITEIARPFVTKDDVLNLYQGEKIKLNFLTNDIVGSSGIKTVNFDSNFLYGTISYSDGAYYYAVSENVDIGQEYISYTVSDNSGLQSNVAKILINIRKTKAIAKDDSIRTTFNFRTKIRPWLNDYSEGSELDVHSLNIVDFPLHGSLDVDERGIVSYQSNSTFTGVDKFTYRIADLNGNSSAPATVFIEVIGAFVPNIITPNDDGINDVFFIVGLNLFDRVELKILTRLGEFVYESENYKNDWLPDQNVKEGTYFYSLNFHKSGFKSHEKKGYVLILRELHHMFR